MKLRIIQKNKQDSIENNQMSEEDENFPAAQQPPSNPMILSGKRKRKPKELIDEVSPILWWTKKKKNQQQQQQQASVDSKAKPLKVYEKRVESKGLRESGEKRKRDAKADDSADLPDQSKSPTMIRAEEFRANLGDDPPNFMKVLVKSHVGSCFWMGLPVPFCKIHLPKHEATVVLENEDGAEFPVKYIGNKTGLSAGWRKFVTGNKLLEGDILIFQLVSSCRFKMYIIRANDLNEVDGALSLLNLDSKTKLNDTDGTTDAHPKKRRRRKSLPLSAVQNNNHNVGPSSPHHPLSEEHSLQPEEQSPQSEEHSLQPEEHSPQPEEHSLQPEEHSGNDSVASEVLECSKLSKPSNHFEEINTFEDFHITVNGVSLDSEIPEDIRQKYYDLCRSKDTFLHERLLPGLYCKLAAGVIFETVNTAEALRSCKLTTPRKEFEVWEKSLRSFELLGLNVGFLKTRLGKLMSLVFDSESGEAARRHLEVSTEREKVDDEIQSLEAKLEALKQVSVKYDGEIEKLKKKAEAYEKNFQEEANAPW